MESLHAKAMLSRPDTAMTAATNATNWMSSRTFSATTFAKRPKSGVLRNFDKSLLPQLGVGSSSTTKNRRPETAVLRPDSSSYYSKLDLIRPDSAVNFKKIRPGSAVTFNTKVFRPFSSIARPESAFIKEDEEDEDRVSQIPKDVSHVQT